MKLKSLPILAAAVIIFGAVAGLAGCRADGAPPTLTPVVTIQPLSLPEKTNQSASSVTEARAVSLPTSVPFSTVSPIVESSGVPKGAANAEDATKGETVSGRVLRRVSDASFVIDGKGRVYNVTVDATTIIVDCASNAIGIDRINATQRVFVTGTINGSAIRARMVRNGSIPSECD